MSRNTVSLALRDDPRVAAATKERVRAAAEALAYRPNLLARAMVTGRSKVIGLAVPRIDFSYIPRLLDAIHEAAFETGHGVLTCFHHNEADRLPAVLSYLYDRQVDGVIVHSPVPPAGRPVPAENRRPAVHLSFGHERLPGLALDLLPGAAGADAVRELAALGHRRVGYAGDGDGFFGAARLAGVRRAAKEHGLRPPATYPGDDSLDGGRAAAGLFLADRSRPTAVVAYTDAVAVGFVQAVAAAGVRVPWDVSVVGADDLPIAQVCAPALTTLRAPAAELGRAAMAALTGSGPVPTGSRVFDWEWIPRGSTAPV